MTYANPNSLCTYICKVYQVHIFLFFNDFRILHLHLGFQVCLLQVAKHFRTASNYIDLELQILFWQDKLATAPSQPGLVDQELLNMKVSNSGWQIISVCMYKAEPQEIHGLMSWGIVCVTCVHLILWTSNNGTLQNPQNKTGRSIWSKLSIYRNNSVSFPML